MFPRKKYAFCLHLYSIHAQEKKHTQTLKSRFFMKELREKKPLKIYCIFSQKRIYTYAKRMKKVILSLFISKINASTI